MTFEQLDYELQNAIVVKFDEKIPREVEFNGAYQWWMLEAKSSAVQGGGVTGGRARAGSGTFLGE